jgi:hypothetical protein
MNCWVLIKALLFVHQKIKLSLVWPCAEALLSAYIQLCMPAHLELLQVAIQDLMSCVDLLLTVDSAANSQDRHRAVFSSAYTRQTSALLLKALTQTCV